MMWALKVSRSMIAAHRRGSVKVAVINRIERTYHNRRRPRALGKLTPIAFETLLQPAVLAA
jgi:putative transposase